MTKEHTHFIQTVYIKFVLALNYSNNVKLGFPYAFIVTQNLDPLGSIYLI